LKRRQIRLFEFSQQVCRLVAHRHLLGRLEDELDGAAQLRAQAGEAGWLLAAACTSAAFSASTRDTFPIVRFQVVGNTLLPDADIQRLLAESTGPACTLRDVQQAIDRLDAAYRAAGFAAANKSGTVDCQVR
jgi:hemolysin activation/secretion protein